jgi:uncharacterized membrane protein (UPF0127 family)
MRDGIMATMAKNFTMLALAALAACTLPASGDSKVTGCVAGAEKGQSPAGLKQVALCIASKDKVHTFTVEIAGTTMEQAKGLMFRTELADNAGMIFPFAQPRPASFWMKNTVIPLDIIFVRSNGTIESIAENTVAYSMDPVVSGEPVAAVLELRGGLTAELRIAAGDKVAWAAK